MVGISSWLSCRWSSNPKHLKHSSMLWHLLWMRPRTIFEACYCFTSIANAAAAYPGLHLEFGPWWWWHSNHLPILETNFRSLLHLKHRPRTSHKAESAGHMYKMKMKTKWCYWWPQLCQSIRSAALFSRDRLCLNAWELRLQLGVINNNFSLLPIATNANLECWSDLSISGVRVLLGQVGVDLRLEHLERWCLCARCWNWTGRHLSVIVGARQHPRKSKQLLIRNKWPLYTCIECSQCHQHKTTDEPQGHRSAPTHLSREIKKTFNPSE